MFGKFYEMLLAWPAWLKMLLLVTITVLALTITVAGIVWLAELIKHADLLFIFLVVQVYGSLKTGRGRVFDTTVRGHTGNYMVFGR